MYERVQWLFKYFCFLNNCMAFEKKNVEQTGHYHTKNVVVVVIVVDVGRRSRVMHWMGQGEKDPEHTRRGGGGGGGGSGLGDMTQKIPVVTDAHVRTVGTEIHTKETQGYGC